MLDISLIAHMAIWFVVAASLISAIDYFVAFWGKIDHTATRRRRHSFLLTRPKKFGVSPDMQPDQDK